MEKGYGQSAAERLVEQNDPAVLFHLTLNPQLCIRIKEHKIIFLFKIQF